jgi:hypothetical protein
MDIERITDSNTGLLTDLQTGASTGVTVTLSQTGGVTWQPDPASGGADCNPLTDADTIFGDRTDLTGVIHYGSTGWTVTATFTGLDPAARYTFVTTANRNGSTYTNRISRYTLSGITSATNSHSAGTTLRAPYGVAFCTGYNTINGYVARWTNIDPGSDGSFTVTAQADGTVNQTYAFDAFMLQREGLGAAPAVNGAPTPANGGGDIAVPAALSVNINDAESNPMDITFYGRSAKAFTVAVLPDTQNYLGQTTNRAIFTEQTQWLRTIGTCIISSL